LILIAGKKILPSLHKYNNNKNISMLRSYSITSKHQWLQRQKSDIFVKERIALGYSSRAAFKIVEIHSKHAIFKYKSWSVLDLGCAPGGWTQVAVKHCKTVICFYIFYCSG
jgi:predicted rRNA methylase YqxC with S4 and FtsJ domains